MLRCSVLFLSILCASAHAQPGDRRTVVVLVRDAETRSALQGARVVVGETPTSTGANGRARLSVEPVDSLRMGIGFVGFAPVDTTVALRLAGVTYVSVGLVPSTVGLEDVVVDGTRLNEYMLDRRGFYQRRETQSGVFLTRADLDSRNVSQFSDIFMAVSGVRIDRGRGLARLVSTRRRGCLMSVFIDGTEAAYLAENVDALPFDDVAAVEVYRGPSEVPMAYSRLRPRTSATCGAVLVWTQIQSEGN